MNRLRSVSSEIERADQALYRAKKENKGGCCLWKKQEIKTNDVLSAQDGGMEEK